MRTITSRLTAILAVATLAVAPGCDDGPTQVPGTETDVTTTDTADADGGTDDGTTSPETQNELPDNETVGPETTTEVDGTVTDDCDDRECGLSPSGVSCGTCTGEDLCNAFGQCVAPANPLGAFCGPNAECPQLIDDPANPGEQILNPDFQNCLNPQCQSGFCFGAQGLTYSSAPVCSQACTITADNVNNATGGNGSDGVDDPSANNPCTGFTDGPNGSDFRCVSYTAPGQGQAVSFCTPGTTFAECKSTQDCPAGEMCAMMRINGIFSERCIGAFKEGDWGQGAKGGEACNEVDPFEDGGLKFCEQGGLCFGFGCASYCDPGADLESPSDDVGCNTTLWEPDTGCDTATNTCMGASTISCTEDIDCSWLECGLIDQTVFSNDPYAADFCFPRGCETNSDCPGDMYCRFSYGGTFDDAGLPQWDHICLPAAEGGVELGEACDPDPSDGVPGATCLSEDMCFGGYCSAICGDDTECAANQLCHVIEFQIEDETVPAGEQSLPLPACLAYEGSKTECLAQSQCPDGERCELYTYFNDDETTAADAPIFKDGLCVTATGAGTTGANCTGPADCAGGVCLGADAEAGTPGFCTEICAQASDCPSIDDGEGGQLNGVCINQWTGYGGDSRRVDTRTYTGICQFTSASAAACGPGQPACATGESCAAIVIGSAANNLPHTDYICLTNTNAEGTPAPSVALGGACDPLAEDADGNPVEQCLSGICFQDAGEDQGYCSQICDPANDTCAADLGIPTAICDSFVTQPRSGAFEVNEGKWFGCRKDENCAPCAFSESCPGDRVCVNLGTDADDAADFRCVPSCTVAADCAGKDGGAECNIGTDLFGTENMGCFDQGATPVNFCDPS